MVCFCGLLQTSVESCPSKSDSIPIPMRRNTTPRDFLSDSETMVIPQ